MTVDDGTLSESQIRRSADGDGVGETSVTAAIVDQTTLNDHQPHDWAQKRALVRVDRRIVDDPADVPAKDGTEWWYGDGHNHRVTVDGIARDFPAKAWSLTVGSLAELWLVIGELERVGHNVRVSLVDSPYRDVDGGRVPTLYVS